jgi:hypothetical protein
MRVKKEDGGNKKKDRLENEDKRVFSTCEFHTAEKGILAGSNPEDFWTKRHRARCKERSENDKIWWG